MSSTTQELFVYEVEGEGTDGKLIGTYAARACARPLRRSGLFRPGKSFVMRQWMIVALYFWRRS